MAGVTTTSVDDEKDEANGGRSTTTSPAPEEHRPRNPSAEKLVSTPAPAPVKVSRTLSNQGDERSSLTSPVPTQTPPPSKPYNVAAAPVGKAVPNAGMPTLASIVKQSSSPIPQSVPSSNQGLMHVETPKSIPDSPKSIADSVHTAIGVEGVGSPRPLISQVVAPSLSTQPQQSQQQLPSARLVREIDFQSPLIYFCFIGSEVGN